MFELKLRHGVSDKDPSEGKPAHIGSVYNDSQIHTTAIVIIITGQNGGQSYIYCKPLPNDRKYYEWQAGRLGEPTPPTRWLGYAHVLM